MSQLPDTDAMSGIACKVWMGTAMSSCSHSRRNGRTVLISRWNRRVVPGPSCLIEKRRIGPKVDEDVVYMQKVMASYASAAKKRRKLRLNSEKQEKIKLAHALFAHEKLLLEPSL